MLCFLHNSLRAPTDAVKNVASFLSKLFHHSFARLLSIRTLQINVWLTGLPFALLFSRVLRKSQAYVEPITIKGSGYEDTKILQYKPLKNAYVLFIGTDMTYMPFRKWEYKRGGHYITYLSSHCKADKSKSRTAHMRMSPKTPATKLYYLKQEETKTEK
jgi:hypothetical protein